MSDLFDEGRDKVMCQVFQWAHANDIEITLRKRFGYGNTQYPELIFRRNNKSLAVGLWPLTDTSAKLEHEWRRIGLELCVEPLELKL